MSNNNKLVKHPMEREAEREKELEKVENEYLKTSEVKSRIAIEKSNGEILLRKQQGNLQIDFLNPTFAWKEIKSYEITDNFVLQPLYYPVRGEYEKEKKNGEIERKTFENMAIILLYADKNGTRDVIYRYKYYTSSFTINDTKLIVNLII